MIYLPKFSVGSKVIVNDEDDGDNNEIGEVIGIEANLKIRKPSKEMTYKTLYLVEIDNRTRRVSEEHLNDVKDIEPDMNTEMNLFLADSLLLTRHSHPDKRIDNTINELRKESGGS